MGNHPDAFRGAFCSMNTFDLAERHPSQQIAKSLWNAFWQRIKPVTAISFSWALKRMYERSIDPDEHLSDAEHAFLFSIYLTSVNSLSEEECREELQRPKPSLVSEYQMLCEEALARTNLLCITDITVLKTLAFYLVRHMSRKISVFSIEGRHR